MNNIIIPACLFLVSYITRCEGYRRTALKENRIGKVAACATHTPKARHLRQAARGVVFGLGTVDFLTFELHYIRYDTLYSLH